jgi:hypothetical protein
MKSEGAHLQRRIFGSSETLVWGNRHEGEGAAGLQRL